MNKPILSLGDNVFFSSTIVDLGHYRRAAQHGLRQIGLHGVRLEQKWPQPTKDERNKKLVEKNVAEVASSNAMLVIRGKRSGSLIHETGFTLTDHELRSAIEHSIPIFMFITPDSTLFEVIQDSSLPQESLTVLESCEVVRRVESPQDLEYQVKEVFANALKGSTRSSLIIPTVPDNFLLHLSQHPEYLQNLEDRRFEQLVAQLLESDDWDPKLIVRINAPGPDIIACATRRIEGIEEQLIVECKRWKPEYLVGVEVVRNLVYWINEEFRSTLGMIATTSRFTQVAINEAKKHRWRLSLRDQEDIIQWIRRVVTRDLSAYH